MKLLKATLCLQFAREPSKLCLNQVTHIQWWEHLLSLPVIPYSVHGLSLSSECPSSIFNFFISSCIEQMAKYLHILFILIALKKLHVFQLWDVHTVRNVTAQNSFLSCSVWLCVRHILNHGQITLVTKSINLSPCFNAVSLKTVLHCAEFKISALNFGSAIEQMQMHCYFKCE